jgi:glutathione synthase/RimK-type ligase-like ATP-grasp enzyme
MKNYPFLRHKVYNKIDRLNIFGSKIDFGKIFNKYEWMPKHVFTREEAIRGDIGFPIIGKSDSGHSGLGVKKFNTPEELQKEPPTFKIESEAGDKELEKQYDLFCQFIDFDMEFRILMFKDKVISYNHRVDRFDNHVNIRNKDEKTKMNFEYVELDKHKIPSWFDEQLKQIIEDIHRVVNMDVWGLDVAINKHTNELKVIECNSQCGLSAIKNCQVYVHLYEDYFDEELPVEFKNVLVDKYIKPMLKNLYELFPREIESSPWAIDYSGIISGKIKHNFFD